MLLGGSTGDNRDMTTEDVTIRPMTLDDRGDMLSTSRATFHHLFARVAVPTPTADQLRRRQGAGGVLVSHLIEADRDGAFVAVEGDTVVGVALAGVRERISFIAQLHVLPGHQGRGVGSRLLAAALGYAAGTDGMLLHSSLDPQAMRCYQRAGFALEPAMQASGPLRRSAIPAVPGVRESDDLELAADVDRGVRRGAHGADLEILRKLGGRLFVVDDGPRRGYAMLDGSPLMVAATDDATAASLLWAALAESDADEVAISVLRADQQWAIDVAVRAHLSLAVTGPLCRRGDTGPCRPYLPHNAIL